MAVTVKLECRKHPRYTAKRRPLDRLRGSPACGCWRLWRLVEEIEKAKNGKASLFLEELNY